MTSQLEQHKTNGSTSDLLVGKDQHNLALVNEDIALHCRGICPSKNAELFSSRKHTTTYVDIPLNNSLTRRLHCLVYDIAHFRPPPLEAKSPPSFEKARRLKCLKLDCSSFDNSCNNECSC
jgi:hypothetical protein